MRTIERLQRQISGLEKEFACHLDRLQTPWKDEAARLSDIVDALRENGPSHTPQLKALPELQIILC